MIFNFFNDPVNIILIVLTVIVSIVLHEIAHAFIALKNGDDTAKRQGRLSVNPLVHFEPTGFIMLVVLGFGFAKPVPVNINNFKNRRKGIFTVAIAGVTVNILLAFVSMPFFLLFGNLVSVWQGNVVFRNFFLFMTLINISLFLFNLLPIFPLDGFRIVEAFAKDNNGFVKFMRAKGIFILLGLLVWSMLIGFFVSFTNVDLSIISVSTPMNNSVIFIDPLNFFIVYLRDCITWVFYSFWGLMI